MKMQIKTMCVHQLTVEDVQALQAVYAIVQEIEDSYGDDCVLMNANDGECISVNELPRVRGILDFITYNRVIEVEHQ